MVGWRAELELESQMVGWRAALAIIFRVRLLGLAIRVRTIMVFRVNKNVMMKWYRYEISKLKVNNQRTK